jgi:hypothetical protein
MANGVHTIDAQKDVENQIARIRDAFASDRLFIDRERCKMHAVEHKGYIWDEKAIKPTPIKEADHAVNSAQYCWSHYILGSAETPEQKKYKQSLAFEIQQKSKQQRGWMS